MKDNQERVLAYALATVIPLSELDDVSGGADGGGMQTRPTVHITGQQGPDATMDW